MKFLTPVTVPVDALMPLCSVLRGRQGEQLRLYLDLIRVSRLLWLRVDERRNPCNRHRDYKALTACFNAEIRKIRKEKGL